MRTERHWWPYPVDPSCVLYLPFYKYGAEQSKIWDISGNNNHGIITGASPGTYSMLSGTELVSNGGMEDGDPPTGWGEWATSLFERSGVQKHSGAYSVHVAGNEMGIGVFQVDLPMVVGKRYKVSFWYYIVSGKLDVMMLDASYIAFEYWKTDTTAGVWLYGEMSGICPSEGGGIFFYNYDSADIEFYIDDVSIQEVTGNEGLGWGFNGVDSVVDCGNGSLLQMGVGDFTVLAWVRPNLRFPGVQVNTFVVKDVLDSGFGLYSAYDAGALLYVALDLWSPPDLWVYAEAYELEHNKWSLVAGVLNRSEETSKVYVNGVVGPTVGDVSVLGSINNTETLRIGKNLVDQVLDGQIGEVLLFNRAFSAQEIRNYYELTRHRYGV